MPPQDADAGDGLHAVSLEEAVTLALRALRHPQSGLAALASAASELLDAHVTAGYLVPASPDPVELLASAGRDAAALGPPGPADDPTAGLIRQWSLDTRPLSTPPPQGCPHPWAGFSHVGRVAVPLPSGAAALVVAGGAEPPDLEILRKVSASVGVLAATVHLNRAGERLRRDLHALRQEQALLAAGLQHDLRTPLSSIIGCARMLRHRSGEFERDSAEELLDIVISQAERLSDMITETLAREASAPGGPLRLRATSLREVAERVATAARAGRGGDIRIEVPETDVVTDAARLERALFNLVDNALKYSAEGKPVYLLGETGTAGVTITVADAGPGVAPEVMPALFSPYARDPERGGAIGLGLHSVAQLAQELGGRISYARQAGWTRFSLFVPDLGEDARESSGSGRKAGP